VKAPVAGVVAPTEPLWAPIVAPLKLAPEIAPVTASDVSVPTEVKLELAILLLRVVPVRVTAAAVTVISAVPSNETPLILRAVAKAVAVPAFPGTEEGAA
jgi:hypothetical protein